MIFVVDRRAVLSAVVAVVVLSTVPVDAELLLGFAASEPVEAHVHRLRLFGDNCVVSDANGGGVVGLDGRWGCGHFILLRVLRNGTICLAMM